jgi:hypothetical protein
MEEWSMNDVTNIDPETGIRFGVTHNQVVGTAWYEWSEPDYGPPTCPKCGGECVIPDYDKHGDYDNSEGDDYTCESCQKLFDGQDVFPIEPLRHVLEDDDGTRATQGGNDWDIFVTKSRYYSKVRLCSPCCPNAGDLSTPDAAYGYKAYCFGHDWYDNLTAPYPVFRVSDDSECFTAKQAVERGAAMLDEVTPDWLDRMRGRLDMASMSADVLGKVYGSTWRGAEALFPGIATKDPSVANDLLSWVGFAVQLDFGNPAKYGRRRQDAPDYDTLDKAWLELVSVRVGVEDTALKIRQYVKGLA